MNTENSENSAAGWPQPLLGLASLAGVIVLAFFAVAIFPVDVFNTWVAFLVMAIIPCQIICGLVWHCARPAALAHLAQPLKGLAFLLLCIVVGAVVAFVFFHIVGAEIAPPTPPLIMFIILSIVVTFWFVIVWGTWPLSRLPVNAVFSGLLSLAACYLAAYALFEWLFDFSFLKGAPFYSEKIDPHGWVMAWRALAFGVTSVSIITLLVLCDFWPLSLFKAKPGGPAFGLIASVYVLALAAGVFYYFVDVNGMDIVKYLVAVPVSFIFGFFIVMSLLQKWPFARMPQPIGGLLSGVAAAAAGAAMHGLYDFVAPVLTRRILSSGAPAYELELWVASAMLAVTFPLIVSQADFFEFWPYRRGRRT